MQKENIAQDTSDQDKSRLYEALRKKAQEDLDEGANAIPASNPIEVFFVGGLTFIALILCAYNAISRWFLHDYIFDFIEEFQVYMVIWAVFLSLGTLTLTDRHVKSDFFVNMFPPFMQKLVGWLADLLGLLFCVTIGYYGFLVAYESWEFGDVSTTMLRTPLWIYFASLPAGALVMGVAYLMRIKRRLTGQGK
ncbi:TRAP transporter small permease [Orrella sp. 11846]|uniref:TRAP transporter small permease n=1 Tax=Orrella sp. 11846 TaxID=3409913 RepID=UPI003B5B42AB